VILKFLRKKLRRRKSDAKNKNVIFRPSRAKEEKARCTMLFKQRESYGFIIHIVLHRFKLIFAQSLNC